MSDTHKHKAKAKVRHSWKAGEKPNRKELLKAYGTLRRGTKKGSPIATCNCSLCKEGRKCAWNQAMIRAAIRSNRQANRRALRELNDEDVVATIPIGYTD